MIKYKSLIADNCGTLQNADLPLDRQGFVLVEGRNELTGGGSNGSGKSTPWEVLNYCLNGSSHKKLKLESIINRHHKELGCFLQTDFNKEGHEYSIQRAKSSPKYGTGIHVYEDSNDITKKGMRRAEAQIREIHGLSQQEFANTVYLTGGFTHTLIAGTPSEKDTYLTKLFQLDVFDRMLIEVKEDLEELREEIGEDQEKLYEWKILRKELKSLPKPSKAKTEELDGKIDVLERTLTKLQKRHKKLLKVSERYHQREKIEKQIEELDASNTNPVELKRILKEKEELLHKVEKVSVWRKQKKLLYKKFKSLPRCKESIDSLRHKIHKFEQRLEDANRNLPVAKERESLLSNYGHVRSRVQSLEKRGIEARSPGEFNRELGRVQSGVEDYRKRIRKLRNIKTAECPTCGHKIDDIEGLVHNFKRRVKKLRKAEKELVRGLEFARKVEESKEDLERCRERLDKLPKVDSRKVKHKIVKFGKLVAQLRDELRSAEKRTEIEEQIHEIPHISKSLPDYNKLKGEVNELHTEYEKERTLQELTSLLKDLPKSAPSNSKLKKLEVKIEKTQDKLHKARGLLDDLKDSFEVYRDKTKRYERLRKSVVKIREKKTEEEALLGLSTAFGRSGLRIPALKRITYVVAESLPLYVRLLFSEQDLKVKVTERENSFDLDLYRKKELIPLNVLSRGERARLSLAFLLTTRRATPASKHTNLLIIDEVLDAIDVSGYDGVIKTIRHLLDHTGVTSCFLVTQNPELAKSKRRQFDQIWVAVKSKPGKSVIQMLD